MKLLFDQNLSPRLVSLLSDLYPHSNHVFTLGMDRVSNDRDCTTARIEQVLRSRRQTIQSLEKDSVTDVLELW